MVLWFSWTGCTGPLHLLHPDRSSIGKLRPPPPHRTHSHSSQSDGLDSLSQRRETTSNNLKTRRSAGLALLALGGALCPGLGPAGAGVPLGGRAAVEEGKRAGFVGLLATYKEPGWTSALSSSRRGGFVLEPMRMRHPLDPAAGAPDRLSAEKARKPGSEWEGGPVYHLSSFSLQSHHRLLRVLAATAGVPAASLAAWYPV